MRTLRTALTLLTTLSLLLALLLSCSREPRHPLLVGTHLWLGYEPLFLARDLGYFSADEIRLLEFTSNSDTIHAFRQGTLDAAALTFDEILRLAQDGIDMKIILVMDVSHGADVVLAHKGIATVTDLKDRLVGVDNSAVGAYMLARALEAHGLSTNDITVVPLEFFEHEQAFTDGKVEAVVTYEPVRSKLLGIGAQQIFDSSQIPGEIVDILAVRSDRLTSQGERLTRLVKAWFQATRYLEKEPEDAIRRMTLRQGISPEEISQALQGLHFPDLAENTALLQAGGAGLTVSGDKLVTIMQRNGFLNKKLDIAPLLSDEVISGL